MYWRLVQGFALVVLLFWAGAFALYVFPGPSTRSVQVAPTAQPYIPVCDRVREEILTQAAKQGLTSTAPGMLDFLRCGGPTPSP